MEICNETKFMKCNEWARRDGIEAWMIEFSVYKVVIGRTLALQVEKLLRWFRYVKRMK